MNTTFADRLIDILVEKTGCKKDEICSRRPTTRAKWARVIAAKQLGDYGFFPPQIGYLLNVSNASALNYLADYDLLFGHNKAFTELANIVNLSIN